MKAAIYKGIVACKTLFLKNIDHESGTENPGTTMEFARFGDYGELGEKMKAAVLKDFDSWNSGYDVYILFAELCGNGMRICSRNHPSFSSMYMEPS